MLPIIHQRGKAASHVTNEQDENEAQYESALNHSYNELFLFIGDELFAKPQVIAMADVSSRLVASMNSFGTVQVKDSTKKHIRRKLDSEFGGALHIFPDSKGNSFSILTSYRCANSPRTTSP